MSDAETAKVVLVGLEAGVRIQPGIYQHFQQWLQRCALAPCEPQAPPCTSKEAEKQPILDTSDFSCVAMTGTAMFDLIEHARQYYQGKRPRHYGALLTDE